MTADQLPSVRIQRSNGRVAISFDVAVIDERNFSTIADELDEVARMPTPQWVTIDLTGVRHIDELGLAILQSLRESIKDVGGRSKLIGPTHLMLRPRTEKKLGQERSKRPSRASQPQWTY